MKRMKHVILLATFVSTGCGYVVEPGHRGLLFNPRGNGLEREVLMPGHHYTGAFGRVDDFDVTYSTHIESIQTTSSEGLRLGLRMEVIYRPISTELYELDTEIGPSYYDEVVGPEFKSAVRGVFAHHSYVELLQKNEAIENEIEDTVRRRIAGKHVEIASVTLEALDYAPEIAQAIQSKLVGEQEALRQKTQLENEALRKKVEIQAQAEQEKLRADNTLTAKSHERAVAEEQAKLDAVVAQSHAATKLAEAHAEAERLQILAKAQTAQNAAITPLTVQMRAYDALSTLAGAGTTVLLGDWSHVPSFLFPANALPNTKLAPAAAPASQTK